MTAPAANSPNLTSLAEVFASLAKAFRSIADAFRQALDILARQLRPYVRLLRRHGRGYSSPAPLSINGHAYTLRRRARTRAGRWRQ